MVERVHEDEPSHAGRPEGQDIGIAADVHAEPRHHVRGDQMRRELFQEARARPHLDHGIQALHGAQEAREPFAVDLPQLGARLPHGPVPGQDLRLGHAAKKRRPAALADMRRRSHPSAKRVMLVVP